MDSTQRDTGSRLIRQTRWKFALLLALRYELLSLIAAGFLLGLIILLVRFVFAVPARAFIWVLPVLLPGTVWAVIRAIKETPSPVATCALFDKSNNCGGLLMAAAEVDLGAWREQLRPLGAPRLRWHCARSFGLCAGAAAFVAISLIVPQRYVSMTSARPLDVSEDIRELQQQIETLEEEEIISEDVAEELQEELEQLAETASAYDPVKTWEALDHLEQSVAKQADEFAASTLSLTENLTQAETLAQGLLEDAAALDAGLLAEAMSELSTKVQSSALQSELFRNSLSADCLEGCKRGNLSEEQLKDLLKAIRANKGKVQSRLSSLCKARLVDLENVTLCEKRGACNSKGLVAFLNENAECMGMGAAVSIYCQSPGKGGVTRGRGDAPMTWTEGSSEENAAFQEKALPPASVAALKDSITIGLSAGAPTVEEHQAVASPGALESAAAGSGEAFSQTILPRHKRVVQQYFEPK